MHVQLPASKSVILAGDDGSPLPTQPPAEFLRQRLPSNSPSACASTRDFDAAQFQPESFWRRLSGRAAVGIAVEIKRQLLAIDDADQFSRPDGCRKTRRGGTGGRGYGALPMVVPATGPGQWRRPDDPGGSIPKCCQRAQLALLAVPGPSFCSGSRAQNWHQGRGDRGGQLEINPGAGVLPFSFDGFRVREAGRTGRFRHRRKDLSKNPATHVRVERAARRLPVDRLIRRAPAVSRSAAGARARRRSCSSVSGLQRRPGRTGAIACSARQTGCARGVTVC